MDPWTMHEKFRLPRQGKSGYDATSYPKETGNSASCRHDEDGGRTENKTAER